jgi:hypothetical protein
MSSLSVIARSFFEEGGSARRAILPCSAVPAAIPVAGGLQQAAYPVFFDTAGYKPIHQDTIKPPPRVLFTKKERGGGKTKEKSKRSGKPGLKHNPFPEPGLSRPGTLKPEFFQA